MFSEPNPEVLEPEPSQDALEYWLNVHQLCDGDLPWLERRQAEQRLIAELDA